MKRYRVFRKKEFVVRTVPCPNCQGTGQIVHDAIVQAVRCRECDGKGVVVVRRAVVRRVVR